MKLDLPEGAKVGSIVVVTWDVAATAKATGHNLEPSPDEGRIVAIDGHMIQVHFDWPGPEFEENHLTTTINLDTAIETIFGWILESIEMRCPLPRSQAIRRLSDL